MPKYTYENSASEISIVIPDNGHPPFLSVADDTEQVAHIVLDRNVISFLYTTLGNVEVQAEGWNFEVREGEC